MEVKLKGVASELNMESKEKKDTVQVASFIFGGHIYGDGEDWEDQDWGQIGTSF